MENEVLIVEKSDGICTLTMNRPRVLNAFDENLSPGLQAAFDQIGSEEEIRVVILTGAGRNFSSGADMKRLHKETGAPEWFKGMKRLGKLIRTMRELPQPIICKVRGAAYGVGINIALAGDFVVAAHDARFCEVFINIGVIMDGGGTYFLPRLVGLVKAREIALLGDEISGKKAASIGLIYKSVAGEKLDREVDSLAGILSEKSSSAMALIKEGLEKSFDMSLAEVMDWEAAHQSIMLQSSEHKEKVRQFLISRGKISE